MGKIDVRKDIIYKIQRSKKSLYINLEKVKILGVLFKKRKTSGSNGPKDKSTGHPCYSIPDLDIGQFLGYVFKREKRLSI